MWTKSLVRRLLVTLLAAGLAVEPVLAEPVVRLASGSLQGKAVGAVEVFLGVPYAAPPVGALRWQPPHPAPVWQGQRDASRFAAACYQSVATPWGPYSMEFIAGEPVREDCLYLNVWKPAGEQRGLPVLVFIHGGGFGGGAGHVPAYDGASLAGRGAVVVTINYRVGVFGFLAHPALSAQSPSRASGNYGLLDQIAALRWVQSNVARFGGNPRNVTIAGESAGAASVNDLQVSPLAKGLFRRGVSFSGASMAIDLPTLAEGEREGLALSERLGARTAESLRAVSAAKLAAATRYVPGAESGPPHLVWVPHLDGVVVPADPDRPDAPLASRVPLLTGFNAEEMVDPAVRTPAGFERAVRARYGAFAERLLALYPHFTEAEAAQSNILVARDRYMTGLLLWARARPKGTRDPIWLYRHDQPYPPVRGGPSFGAFHSSELAYVFGTIGLGDRSFGAQDQAVVRQWQDRLLSFMRRGDPSLPGRPWPAAGDRNTQVMAIGARERLRPAVSTPERFEAFRAYAASGGRLGLM